MQGATRGDLVWLQLRYANNSNYKNDTMIRKEAYVSTAVLDELRRIIEDSEVGTTFLVLCHPGHARCSAGEGAVGHLLLRRS